MDEPVLLVRVVAGFRQVETCGQEVIGTKPEVCMREPMQAAQQQSCAHEEHHSEGNFTDDEGGTEATGGGSAGGAGAFAQSPCEIGR